MGLKLFAPTKKMTSPLTNKRAANLIEFCSILKLTQHAKRHILTVTDPFFWGLETNDSNLIWTKRISMCLFYGYIIDATQAGKTWASNYVRKTTVYSL